MQGKRAWWRARASKRVLCIIYLGFRGSKIGAGGGGGKEVEVVVQRAATQDLKQLQSKGTAKGEKRGPGVGRGGVCA